MSDTPPSQVYANLLLVAVTLLAAMGWIFSKYVLVAMSPMFFLATRFILSAVIVGGFRPKTVLRAPLQHIIRPLLTGTLLGIQIAMWGYGLMLSDGLGVGAFLISLSFLLIPVTGLLFGYRARPYTWIAIIVAVPGLALLALRHGFALAASDIVFLLSAVLYSLYFNINGRLCAGIPPVTQTTYQLFAVSVVCALAYGFWESDQTQSFAGVWLWFVLSIVLATCLRFFLLLKAQSMEPEGQGAIVMTLEPVWVAILSTLYMNETLSLTALSGMAIIFLALLINAVGTVRVARQMKRARQAVADD